MNSFPLKVIDLSHRLPGPLATSLLANDGHKVIKVEDQKFGDPFTDGLFAQMDPSFLDWYKNLNGKKEIKKIDFKDPTHQKELQELVLKADIIFLGLPPKIQNLIGLTPEFLEAHMPKGVIIEMGSTINSSKGMHDLNILAEKGLLKSFIAEHSDQDIIRPPFFPIAGILYGSSLARIALSQYIRSLSLEKAVHKKFTLEEAVNESLLPFFSETLQNQEQHKFLHNGRYPCYCIYKLKDSGHVALACVEEKYWSALCETLSLPLSPEQRFHHSDQSIFNLLRDKFSSLTFEEANSTLSPLDLCTSVIGP